MDTASPSGTYLPSQQRRARLMRLESAAILKRFFFCEKALIRGLAGWIPATAPFELKMSMAHIVWQDAEVAGALRRRVFELRYPNRLMEEGADAPLVSLYEAARHAPGAAAYLNAVATVLMPSLGHAYRAYLEVADALGDGPTRRFLELAVVEKERQTAELTAGANLLLAATAPDERAIAMIWTEAVRTRLHNLGGISLEEPSVQSDHMPLPGTTPFTLAQIPARDPRFHLGRFYWPDNVDPTYPYGSGPQLQLRSAVSHLNEVWAVDTAGAILEAFADPLGWDFMADAARWLYDESRHATMGLTRLRDWGFAPHELPLGSYIYDSAREQDPLYRLGFLFFFETKNIGKKPKRAETFASYGDAVSQHDMDFDWADESIHASYGKHWLTELIAVRGLPPETFVAVQERCAELVAATVASATPEEIAGITDAADRLIQHATALAIPAS